MSGNVSSSGAETSKRGSLRPLRCLCPLCLRPLLPRFQFANKLWRFAISQRTTNALFYSKTLGFLRVALTAVL